MIAVKAQKDMHIEGRTFLYERTVGNRSSGLVVKRGVVLADDAEEAIKDLLERMSGVYSIRLYPGPLVISNNPDTGRLSIDVKDAKPVAEWFTPEAYAWETGTLRVASGKVWGREGVHNMLVLHDLESGEDIVKELGEARRD